MDSGVYPAGLDGRTLERDHNAGGFRMVLDRLVPPFDGSKTDPLDRDHVAGGNRDRSTDHECNSEKSGRAYPAL